MELRQGGQTLPLVPAALKAQLGEQASPHLLLLAHGLCMNDTQWRRSGHDHGEVLAQALGCTPVYLRYNSGLHTSTNGHQLALLLERLVAAWPVPLERITIVGHSMGGLVARSAVQVAREAGQRWPGLLRELVFLGTPHHGAPLERAGHGVDLLLALSPHTAPFARLGKIRSAGITDLRHGHVLDADWEGRDRFESPDDHRVPLPLPEGVACFAVAATLAGQRGLLADRLTGDGLVPLHSALGQHEDPARRLVFAKGSQHIVYRTGHLDLLSSDKVVAQVLAWLRPAPAVED
jgi:pimeloyl-ACP methyl ester carboxylesterase